MSLGKLFACSILFASLATATPPFAAAFKDSSIPLPPRMEIVERNIAYEATQRVVIINRIKRSFGLEIDIRSFDLDEILAMAKNVYFEARSEGLIGQIAVANVTLNRVADEAFPATVEEVVYEPSQFSWTLEHNPTVTELDAFRRAVDVALLTMSGQVADVTGGSTFYYSFKIMKRPPHWARAMVQTTDIGTHRFYTTKVPTS